MPIMKTCSKCRKKYEYGKKCSCVNKHKKKALAIKGKDDDFYTTPRWRNLRKQVILRDGAYCQRCFYLFQTYTFEKLEVHHIVARSVNKELQYEPNNLVTVCKTCNLELGTNGVDWDHKVEKLQEPCV